MFLYSPQVTLLLAATLAYSYPITQYQIKYEGPQAHRERAQPVHRVQYVHQEPQETQEEAQVQYHHPAPVYTHEEPKAQSQPEEQRVYSHGQGHDEFVDYYVSRRL